MKRLTFKQYTKRIDKPLKHVILGVKVCDISGNEFDIEHNELSNDWAYAAHSGTVRGLLRENYTEIKE